MRTLYESILDTKDKKIRDIDIMSDRHKQRYAVMGVFKECFTIKDPIAYKACSIKRSNYGIIRDFADKLEKLPFITNVDVDGSRETPCSDPRLSCIVTAYDMKGWTFHFSFNKVQNCVTYIIDTSDYNCRMTDYLQENKWHL